MFDILLDTEKEHGVNCISRPSCHKLLFHCGKL